MPVSGEFRADQRGTTAIEYAIAAVFVSLAITAGRSIGSNMRAGTYGPIASNLN